MTKDYLDLHIIDEIRKKKQKEMEEQRPYLELPLYDDYNREDVKPEKPEPKRVIIIDI